MTQFIVFQELITYENISQPVSVAALVVEADTEDQAAKLVSGSGMLMPDAAMGVAPIADRKTFAVQLSATVTEQDSPT